MRRREWAWLGLLVLLGATLGFWAGWKRHAVLEERELCELAAVAAAGLVDRELAVLSGEERDQSRPMYRHVQAQLARVREAKDGLRFVYLMRRLGPAEFIFLVDSEPVDSPDHSPPGAPLDLESDPVFMKGIASGKAFFSPAYEDVFGTWVSATAPVAPSVGEPRHFLGVDFPAGTYRQAAILMGSTSAATGTLLVLVPGWLVLRHRADRRLASRERRLASALDQGRDPTFVADLAGRLVWANDAFLGLAGGAGPGSDCLLLPARWELPDHEATAWRGLLERRRAGELECTARVGGRARRLQWRFTIVVDVAGIPEEILATGRDVTDERAADEALREAEERFRLIVESCADGFWDSRYDRGTSFYSRRWKEILGYGPDDLGDLLTAWMDLLHPDDRDKIRAAASQIGTPGHRQFRARFRMRHRLGHWVWIESTGIEVRGESGLVARSLGFHRDISEEVALQAKLEEALASAEASAEAARAADRAKTVFLATMGHEIRTPLNGILGFAALLGESELDEESREFAGIIRANGEALLALLDQVLDYARLEGGKPRLDPVEVDLVPLLEGIADLFGPRAQDAGLALTWSVDPAVPAKVMADAVRLRQVLVNLVGNALKFTEQGGVEVRVLGGEVLPDGRAWTRVEVHDSGAGIPEEQLHLLFKPFSQVDGSLARKHGGTGLGLAIVRSIVEAFGGRVGVLSRDGAGSTFWFEVPLVVLRPGPGEPPAEAPGVSVALPDDPVAEAAISRLVRRRGIRVVPPGEARVHLVGDPALATSGTAIWVRHGRGATRGAGHVLPMPFRLRELERVLQAAGIDLPKSV